MNAEQGKSGTLLACIIKIRMRKIKREELVDVIVMCQQMFLVLKMDDKEINKRAGEKLVRALR